MQNIKVITDPVNYFRKEREKICFPIINRGKLWYDSLTLEQLSELRDWYNKWLDVTKTLVIPKAPKWLNKKVSYEEEIL